MPYNSTITFTLDTICPWTYLALLRLRTALSTHNKTHPTTPVNFTLLLAPYELHPQIPPAGEEKRTWYLRERYAGSESRLAKYEAHMAALGEREGVKFSFDGVVANTFQTHRVLWCVQEAWGGEKAVEVLMGLYEGYFTRGSHPSSRETLEKACRAAGLSEEECRRIVEDESEGAADTKMAIREQTGNGVDSVPYIVFEGKRRDFTLIGAKEVGEYVKTMEQVVKEAS